MVIAKTNYFGEIVANENDDDIEFVTKINVTGREQDISVLLKIEEISQVIDVCVDILNDYMEIFEIGKKILKTEYYRNNDMILFFNGLLEKYGEAKIVKLFGNKNITGKKINDFIEKLDGPDITIEVSKGEKNIFLVYGLSNEIDEMIVIKMNRKYEKRDIRYYD